jgi:hypothetical protein
MKVIWLWRASCGLSGYKSRWHRHQFVAHLLALWHSIGQHPYGHMTIACVDTETYASNRRTATDSQEGC